jgi:hypothetical protein
MDTLDIIREIERDPGLRASLRAVLLGDEFLTLPAQVRENTKAIAVLINEQRRMTAEVGKLKGDNLEWIFERHPRRWLRRGYANAVHVLTENEMDFLFDQVDVGVANEIELADAIVTMQLATEDQVGERQVTGVVEVSWTIEPHDITRAFARAHLLASLGHPVVPIVAGAVIPPQELIDLAKAEGVAVLVRDSDVLTRGKIIEPH